MRRHGVQTGIVHIGVGNFHRSHQAWYLHHLADPDWQICGLGILPGDAAVRDGLRDQDYAYSLLLKDSDGTIDREVITSIKDYLLVPEDPWAAVERLADPATRIVSLTITEGGYNVDDATGRFDTDNAPVRRDAGRDVAPHTAFGVVVQALARRRQAGQPAFTVMSCDNVPHNGNVARLAFTSFAALLDDDLAAWVDSEVAFPNTMVDRITLQRQQKTVTSCAPTIP